MLVGYEREFFVFENGRVARAKVSRDYRDKQSRFRAGFLVEARGCPASLPQHALEAYNKALTVLKHEAERYHQTLFLAAELPTPEGLVQAGLHIHFGLRAGENASLLQLALEQHFGDLITKYQRHHNPNLENEKKLWGFEFRRLPATANIERVVEILTKNWPKQ